MFNSSKQPKPDLKQDSEAALPKIKTQYTWKMICNHKKGNVT